MKSPPKVIVAGAGIAGLSAAWHLQKKGMDCRVFEKEDEVGGLCRSKRVRNFIFDQSGHLLHFKSRYGLYFVRSLLGNNLVRHRRSAWVYSFGGYTRYPFQANLFGLPPQVANECLVGFIRARKNKSLNGCRNFAEWLERTFGTGMVRHFLHPYNTKFWTVPPKELTCEWVDVMIPVPSLRQVFQGARKESAKRLGYNANFWYPKRGGIDQLPKTLARRIKNIRTGEKISRIDLGKKEIEMSSGRKEKYDVLISSIPLPEMARLVRGLPKEVRAAFHRLRWNSIFNLNLGLATRGNALKRHWTYFPENATCFFRVGVPHHYSSGLTPAGKGSLYAEVSYSVRKPLHKRKVISRITRDLKKIGILSGKGSVCAKDINDIQYGYPIYDRHYKAAREKILKFLGRHNIIPCGRYGSWQYMSMEDAILDGKRATDYCLRKLEVLYRGCVFGRYRAMSSWGIF